MDEDKDLLIKDLYGRLLYGVECKDIYTNVSGKLDEISTRYNMCRLSDVYGELETCYIPNCRPYLFPLSSMTEEQEKEISKRYNYHNYFGLCIEITNHSEGYWDKDTSCNLQDYLWLEDWYNKNHFDYRGLIEKGLAIDATDKNIY